MVYEHLSKCFIPEDPPLGFFELFQAIVAHRDTPRSMALVLGASKLLAMEKNIGGLHPIDISKVFFQLISHLIVL